MQVRYGAVKWRNIYYLTNSTDWVFDSLCRHNISRAYVLLVRTTEVPDTGAWYTSMYLEIRRMEFFVP